MFTTYQPLPPRGVNDRSGRNAARRLVAGQAHRRALNNRQRSSPLGAVQPFPGRMRTATMTARPKLSASSRKACA